MAKSTRKRTPKNAMPGQLRPLYDVSGEMALGEFPGGESMHSSDSVLTLYGHPPFGDQRLQAKTLLWPELRSGDCVMRENSRLTLIEDGTFMFHCVILSTDNNDIWHHHFKLFDATNVFLFDLPILGDNWNYDFNTGKENEWHEFSFFETSEFLKFPKSLYPRIAKGSARYSC
jgi:hypothetical protein